MEHTCLFTGKKWLTYRRGECRSTKMIVLFGRYGVARCELTKILPKPFSYFLGLQLIKLKKKKSHITLLRYNDTDRELVVTGGPVWARWLPWLCRKPSYNPPVWRSHKQKCFQSYFWNSLMQVLHSVKILTMDKICRILMCFDNMQYLVGLYWCLPLVLFISYYWAGGQSQKCTSSTRSGFN